MKIRLANYISQYLLQHGISNIFSVVGGGAMHLNDALGHQQGLYVTYTHHEQAAAMAAEAYYRVNNQLACACVTSGPGGTNAITGVLCAFTDSIPMLVLSGQVPRTSSAASTNAGVRFFGVQEANIISAVKTMTKYAVTINDPEKIRYHLEKALYLAKSDRPGPVWLDIPLDVQGAIIDTDELNGFSQQEIPPDHDVITNGILQKILTKIQTAERPIIIAGSGIRLSSGHSEFLDLVSCLSVPVLTCMSSVDALPSDHPLFAGRVGPTGTRGGNFAMQNSDLLLSIGSRLGIAVTGFNFKAWARAAYKIMVDIDRAELNKSQVPIDMPICADAREFISALVNICHKNPLKANDKWLKQCTTWKKNYPVVNASHYQDGDKANIYAFFNELTKSLPEKSLMVVSVGGVRFVGSQSAVIKEGTRFITNPTTAAMGYCLPASIGMCIASGKKPVVCVTGEGSLQMNIQELQTIRHHKLPVRIFVVNNGGYHSIRQTQHSYFEGKLIGIGAESGDLSFPDLEKIAAAYEIPYLSCANNSQLQKVIAKILDSNSPMICEIFVDTVQGIAPKLASRKLEGGRMISSTLENMYPFLPPDELERNLLVPPWNDEEDL